MQLFTPLYVNEKEFEWGKVLNFSCRAKDLIDFINENKYKGKDGVEYFNFDLKRSKEGKAYTSVFVPDKDKSKEYKGEKTEQASIAEEIFKKKEEEGIKPEDLPF